MVTVSLIASLVGVGVLVVAGMVRLYQNLKAFSRRRRKASEIEVTVEEADDVPTVVK